MTEIRTDVDQTILSPKEMGLRELTIHNTSKTGQITAWAKGCDFVDFERRLFTEHCHVGSEGKLTLRKVKDHIWELI